MDRTILRKVASLHPSEIMQPYDALLGLDGFDAVFEFAEQLGGFTVYVPKVRTIFARCLEKEVMREFNGSNFAGLAKKYGFTERHIRRLVSS